MSLIVPPVTSMPLPQAATPTPQQAPSAVQAAAAVTAVPVRTETRMAPGASGNSGGSEGTKGKKGKDSDRGADATEARTNRAGTRPRGMGNRADLSV